MAANVPNWCAAMLGAAACCLMFAIVPSAAAQTPASKANGADDEVPGSFRYHLRNDNNFVLHAARLDAQGAETPARAKVVIARDGQIFASVRTDEWGGAQVIGLPPAVYSVLTAGAEGFAAFTVRAFPFEPLEQAGKQGSKPGSGAAPQAPIERRDSSAVQIHLVPHSDYALLKTMIQHKEPFVLLVIREGDVVSFVRPRENGSYSLAGIATGCYSVLGGGITRGVRTFYASRVYHVAAAKGAGSPGRAGAQLLPGGRSPHIELAADAAAPDFEQSPVPVSDFPILDNIVKEFRAPTPAAPAAGAEAAASAAGAAGAGGAGLGGLLGAAGAGLGAAGLSGGGGGGGTGGGGGVASDFIPSHSRSSPPKSR